MSESVRSDDAVEPVTHGLQRARAGDRDVSGVRCLSCARASLYLRRRCEGCDGRNVEPARLTLAGVVDAATTVRRSRNPVWRDRVPWTIAHVSLDSGPTVLAYSTTEATSLIGNQVELICAEDETSGSIRLDATLSAPDRA